MKNLLISILLLLSTPSSHAETLLKPFILASTENAPIETVKDATLQKISQAGFKLAGQYSPYKGTLILVITSDLLTEVAARSDQGAYGATIRVALTQADSGVQVSYNNPTYLSHAYRLNSDLGQIAEKLKSTLGFQQEFGAAEGLSPSALRKYHYMFGMEYFDDPSDLGEFKDYDQAVKVVESGLFAKKGGTSKVYRIDIPNKQETVFGVHLTQECSSDQFIMDKIDFMPIKSSAHLPYEILVSGNKVYALYARFRIAINFPDLKMVGDNSFMKIMCAPGAIEDALKEVVH